MAKLVYLLRGMVVSEHPLNKERITIGRNAGNDICLESLAVSGAHAVVVTIGRDSFVEDLGSTNGTLVNGTAIKRHVLQHEDVIRLGKCQLKYMSEV